MSKPRRTALCLFICLFLALPATHDAGATMPAQNLTPNLETLLGLYPGATIINTMTMGDVELAVLNCGQTPINDVADYYIPKLQNAGFIISMNQAMQDNRTIISDKSPYQAMVALNVENGETLTTLSLSGITPGEAIAVEQSGTPAETPAVVTVPEQDTPGEQANSQPEDQPADTPAEESLAAQIQEYVTIPPGDTIVDEFRNPDAMEVEIESQAGWQDIFQYYSLTLSKDGWQALNKFLEDDGGLITFQKEGMTLVLVTNETTPATRYSLILKQ